MVSPDNFPLFPLFYEVVLISPQPELLPDVVGQNLGRSPDFGENNS
jgi:hypothetical protein